MCELFFDRHDCIVGIHLSTRRSECYITGSFFRDVDVDPISAFQTPCGVYSTFTFNVVSWSPILTQIDVESGLHLPIAIYIDRTQRAH